MWLKVLKILKYAIPIALVATLAILIAMLVKNTREMQRMKNNFDTEMLKEYSTQQEITKKELKQYFKEEVEHLKEFGIKPSQVENIVNVSYVYKDTLLYKDTLVYVYDTILNTKVSDFDIAGNCWNIKGFITDSNITVNDFEMNDSILVSLYKEKRKCLFEKRKVKAIAISSCKGDTLTILRNLKIQK